MSLMDFLRNRNNNNQEIQAVVQGMNEPQTDLAIQNQVGNAQDNSTAWQRIRNNMNNVQLFDRYENPTNEANTVTTDADGNPVLNSTVGTPVLAQRGFLNDLARGAKENYNNGFSLNNWQDKENKGFGTRLGEAAGTIGRVLNSPLGRGLITAGVVRATGGDGLEALTFGSQAAALNQQNVANDKMYRNALKDYGYDLDNLKGYVGKDAFNTVANNVYKNNALQVRQAIASQNDNTRRANMIMSGLRNGMITPEEAQTLMDSYGITINDLQNSNETQLLPYKQYAMQIAPQIAMGNLGVAQGNLALNTQKFLNELENANNPKMTAADKKAMVENMQTLADIDAGIELINKNPSAYGPAKGLLPASALNIVDSKGIPTRTQIDNITAVYRKWLTGAQMSDAERKAYERFLPAPTDTGEAVLYKLQGMKNSIQRKNDVIMSTYGNNFNIPSANTNKDPLGIM